MSTDDRIPEQPEEDAATALSLLKLLADDTRWKLINDLRLSDRQVSELVTRLRLPQNLVSYHLNLLRQAGLVQVRRSDADARVTYYGLDIAALQAGYRQIGMQLHLPDIPTGDMLPMVPVVFLCTGNSIRSQMAEGWLRHLSGGRVPVRSAGVHPTKIHPLVVQVMAEVGIDIGYQQPKHIDAISDITPSVVVTVCDLAREECRSCLDAPVQLHWSIPNPMLAETSAEIQLAALRATREQLRRRVIGLLALLPTVSTPHSE
ncbi:MAG: ArsR family transcriptional regulator [Chloroflexaceae bacterium]